MPMFCLLWARMRIYFTLPSPSVEQCWWVMTLSPQFLTQTSSSWMTSAPNTGPSLMPTILQPVFKSLDSILMILWWMQLLEASVENICHQVCENIFHSKYLFISSKMSWWTNLRNLYIIGGLMLITGQRRPSFPLIQSLFYKTNNRRWFHSWLE